MHTGPLRRRGLVVGISVMAGALALSACNAKTTTPGKKSALDIVKKNGKIVVATDASYAPNEFKQNGQVVGFDVDMANGIAKKLGVTADVQDVKFDNILPALQAKKYDISLSSFTDNKQREQSFDFVTYFSAGTGLMVKAGNPLKLSPDALPGDPSWLVTWHWHSPLRSEAWLSSEAQTSVWLGSVSVTPL